MEATRDEPERIEDGGWRMDKVNNNRSSSEARRGLASVLLLIPIHSKHKCHHYWIGSNRNN